MKISRFENNRLQNNVEFVNFENFSIIKTHAMEIKFISSVDQARSASKSYLGKYKIQTNSILIISESFNGTLMSHAKNIERAKHSSIKKGKENNTISC